MKKRVQLFLASGQNAFRLVKSTNSPQRMYTSTNSTHQHCAFKLPHNAPDNQTFLCRKKSFVLRGCVFRTWNCLTGIRPSDPPLGEDSTQLAPGRGIWDHNPIHRWTIKITEAPLHPLRCAKRGQCKLGEEYLLVRSTVAESHTSSTAFFERWEVHCYFAQTTG